MSYDLMLFDNKKAPETKPEFLAWFEKQTQWSEDHSYEDPDVTSASLRDCFMELIQTFPPLNGSLSPSEEEIDALEEDDKESYLTDYSVGTQVIYGAFAWSVADEALELVQDLAKKHHVGFFNPSSSNGDLEYHL